MLAEHLSCKQEVIRSSRIGGIALLVSHKMDVHRKPETEP